MSMKLTGRIDSNNAAILEKDLLTELEGQTGAPVVLDASGLEYISSAGLRVLLSTQKVMNKQGKMTIRNVKPEIMEIFEATGFVDILNIEE